MHEDSLHLELLSEVTPSKRHWRVTLVVVYVSEYNCWVSHVGIAVRVFYDTALCCERNFMEKRLLVAREDAQPVSSSSVAPCTIRAQM